MKGMMEAYVGADYECGLDMLKAYVEEGEVPSNLEFVGKKEFEGSKWFGIKTNCALEVVGTQMEADFGMVRALAEEQGLGDTQMMTIYYKWDIPKGRVSYTAALAVKEVPTDLPEKMTTGNIQQCECYALRHIGRYQHLGNAWSTLYTMMRNKEIKHNRKIDPFELYL